MKSSRIINFFFLGFLLCLTSIQSLAQTDLIKFMSYNLLNYPSASPNDTTTKNPYFRTIINANNPDILVVNELVSIVGSNAILNKVLNVSSTQFASANFVDGPDTDNQLYFRTSKFQLLSQSVIPTALRDINEYVLRHIASNESILIYAVHLKASTGNEILRGAEIDSLRKRTNLLPTGSKFIVCGDFNIYTTTEVAYQKLLAVTSPFDGEFYDPFSISGQFNQLSLAQYHTQSTRTVSFGGGATGGLDDRFDMILFSDAIKNGTAVSYLSNSCFAYGNDGAHYNAPINNPTNNAVSTTVANALYNASDHLPVIASFQITNTTSNIYDLGLTQFIAPSITPCNNFNKPLTVRVKNYSTIPINFAGNNATISLNVVKPNLSTQSFTYLINSGTLAPNSTSDIIVDVFDMINPGTYTFNGSITIINDPVSSNNAISSTNLIIPNLPVVTISPSQNQTICNGSSVTLTSSAGVSYIWSNGATTQSVVINTTGNFSVTVTDVNACQSISNPVLVTVLTTSASTNIFNETLGNSPSTTSIATHEANNAFDNDNLTMTGTADMRNTAPSSIYTQASALANVFFTNIAGRYFEISGINTSSYSSIQLSFGILKTNTPANGSELQLQVSTDGLVYSNLSFAILTNNLWNYRIANGNIPSTNNLRIRFTQTTTISQFRIDDILLTGTITPIITAGGSTTLCTGDSVLLTSTSGANYLWNTGATTQSIYAKISGTYSVQTNCTPSNSIAINIINCNTVVNIKLIIQGLYNSSTNLMEPLLFNLGESSIPTDCDSISIYFYLLNNLSLPAITKNTKIDISGNSNVSLNGFETNKTYYLVVKHRNAIETWSKLPVYISGSSVFYDFSN